MCQTCFQSHRLNIQNLITSSVALFLHGRHERLWIESSCQFCFFFLQLELCFIIKDVVFLFISGKQICCHSASLIDKPLQIEIGIDCPRSKTFALRQKYPILCNQIMSAVHNILCRFALTRRRVDIATEQSRRLVSYETSTIGILANHFITRRQIDDECRTV